jgi:hypothetical protein
MRSGQHVRAFLLTTALAALTLPIAACGGVSSPSSNTTQTFPGTLQPSGSNVHPFTTSKQGEFQIAIKALDPVVVVGLALGQYSSGVCLATSYADPFATLNKSVSGSIQPGSYCAIIYDTTNGGPLRSDVTYTLSVSHP